MLLNDVTIKQYIRNGSIGVDSDVSSEQIQPASLDVRLGDEAYDPATDELQTDEIEIEPYQFLLSYTRERFEIPAFLAAQMTGRSSMGRRGIIVHATAGWIDPGFRGQITLEMFNMSRETVTLDPGSRVAQLVFLALVGAAENPYDGQYQDQEGIIR